MLKLFNLSLILQNQTSSSIESSRSSLVGDAEAKLN